VNGVSAYRDERYALTFVVSRDTLSLRVKGQDTIDQESVPVVPVLQFEGEEPRAIRHVFHGMHRWVPLVKVTHQADGFRLRSVADEVHRPERFVVS